jgi:hypothetical protein
MKSGYEKIIYNVLNNLSVLPSILMIEKINASGGTKFAVQ